MVVYRIKNVINGKVYIGKTVQPIKKYWRDQLSAARRGLTGKVALYNAIRKYGADTFIVEVIYQTKTPTELSAMETFFIILHQSHKRENGYNLTLGGEGFSSGELNPKFGKKAPRGKLHPMFGRHHSEKSNQLNREAHLGKTASFKTRTLWSKQRTGKKRPPETGKRIAASKIGRKFPKLSQALKGKPKSEQARKNMSIAAKLRAQRPESLEVLRANGRKTALLRQTRGHNAA